MKVTALIDDKMIQEAVKYSNAKNITEALKVALREYIAIEKTKELIKQVEIENFEFTHTAEEIRNINRQL